MLEIQLQIKTYDPFVFLLRRGIDRSKNVEYNFVAFDKYYYHKHGVWDE